MPWILWLMTADPLLILAPVPPIAALVLLRRRVISTWRQASRLAGAWPDITGATLVSRIISNRGGVKPQLDVVDQAPRDRVDPGLGVIRISRRVGQGTDQAAQALALLVAAEWLATRRTAWFRIARGLLTAWLTPAALLAWVLLATGLVYRWNTLYAWGAIGLWGLAGAVALGYVLDRHGWNQWRRTGSEQTGDGERLRTIEPVCCGLLGRDVACCLGLGPLRRPAPDPTLTVPHPAR